MRDNLNGIGTDRWLLGEALSGQAGRDGVAAEPVGRAES